MERNAEETRKTRVGRNFIEKSRGERVSGWLWVRHGLRKWGPLSLICTLYILAF